MDAPDTRIKKMAEIFKILQDSVTKEEFMQAFDVLRKQVAKMSKSNETDFKLMHSAIDALSAKLKADNNGDMQGMQKECDAMMQKCWSALEKKLASVKDGEDGYNGVDGQDADPADVVPLVLAAMPDPEYDTGDDIIDKINSADGLISKRAVEGFTELEKAVREKTGNTTRIGWGAHPLTVKGLGKVIDKNTRYIDFEGSGVSSVVRSQDGVVKVTISGGSTVTGFQSPLTGGLTGTNTWTTAPNVLVIDGVPRQKVQTDGTVMWTGTTTTVLTNAPLPTFDIFSTA